MRLLLICYTLLSISLCAQTDTASSLLSRFYLPFDFGATITQNKNMRPGILIKTGLEYRFKKTNSLFARFNFDNRSNNYKLPNNPTTNVTEGKIRFNDYVVGIGYRIGKKKIKALGLLQGGISTHEYPTLQGTTNNFIIVDRQVETPIFKLALGVEYYIAQNAALTLDTGCSLISDQSIFWSKHLSIFEISLGLTASLF